MNRELEQELLSCPIGDLVDFDDDNHNGIDDDTNLQIQQNYLDTMASTWSGSEQTLLQYPLHNDVTTAAALSPTAPMPSVMSTDLDLQEATDPCTSSAGHVGATQARPTNFIHQVFRILDDAQQYNFEHIVSWLPDGASFKVHKIQDFETKILPRYLEQTKVRSFQRQLIKHGFERIQGGASRGAYSHPKFIRDDPKSCLSIEKVKRNRLGDETGVSKDPAVKLGEMSDHFRQAVQESRPVKIKSRSVKKPSLNQHMYQDTTPLIGAFSNESFKNVVIDTMDMNDQSFSWPSDDSIQSSRQKQDPLVAHRRSNSIGNSGFVSRGWLGKSHSSPGQIEGMHRTIHNRNPMVSQKIILSRFLPTRLPGHADVADFDGSDLQSYSTNQSKHDLPQLPADFSQLTPTTSSSRVERPDASFSFRMASSLFDHSSDAEGNFWHG